jgi:hypothetical protein
MFVTIPERMNSFWSHYHTTSSLGTALLQPPLERFFGALIEALLHPLIEAFLNPLFKPFSSTQIIAFLSPLLESLSLRFLLYLLVDF